MSSTRTTSLNTHHTNGSVNSYDINDATSNMNYPSGNNSEFDSILQRSSLMRNVSQYDGIYRNARFIHALSSGLLGQQVVIQTSDHERFHGVLETLSPNGDIVLTVSHRLDNNNNDIISSSSLPIDHVDTNDNSSQIFELHKRIIKASNIVEIIAVDMDLSSISKCSLDENPKTSQLEDDRFSRMEHFYGSDEIDPETLEDLDLGDNGKAGFDPEDMFHTNREKFNTTTDFDESKYTNVPVPQKSTIELAEIEKKVQEIERDTRADDVNEDDADVHRPLESHNLEDGNSNNIKSNRLNRNDIEHNSSKRDNWRSTNYNNNHNRRNNSKQNQFNNRQQYNTRISRNNRFIDTHLPNEGRDLSLQTTNEQSTQHQRLNSSNLSQGQSSNPTSPSTNLPPRTIYRSSNNRNSPASYASNSSSRNNSISATSSPPNQQLETKKSSFNEQQLINDDSDQLKQQQQNSSQLQTSLVSHDTSPPLLHSIQDDNSTSHDTINTNQSNTTGTTTPNSTKSNAALNPEADEFVPVFSRESSSRPESRGGSTTSSISMNVYPHLHPQAALHLLQQQQQQAQTQSPLPIISTTNPQAAAALYQQYYSASFANMPQLINATPQQMPVGVMGAPIIPSQSIITTGLNSNNGSSSGMTTPNSSVSAGPTYKVNNNNNNQANSGDNSNTGVNNIPPKKAVVSVQRPEQSNIHQQQQQQQPQMVYPAPQLRYYPSDYITQPGTAQSMQLQQIPFYYPSGLIQATATAGQPQNIMIPPASSSAGSVASGLHPLHYTGVYADPRMYNLYSSAAALNQASINPNWQLARSPPQQQQQQSTDQQRNYGSGQNVASVQTSSNTGNRSTPTSGSSSQSGTGNGGGGGGGGPPLAPQYTLNGAIPTAYAYGAPAGWIHHSQQVPTPQTNIPPQMNGAYNVVFDPSQHVPPQQATYIHSSPYETPAYFSQQSQQQQQTPPQQGLDTVQQGNYNR